LFAKSKITITAKFTHDVLSCVAENNSEVMIIYLVNVKPLHYWRSQLLNYLPMLFFLLSFLFTTMRGAFGRVPSR
jgi:hypothetical protein